MPSKLFFTYGAMNSGKSMHLLAKAYNFEERNIPFILLKSSIDTRDGSNVIHSRALGSRECITVSPSTNILSLVKNEIVNTNIYPKWVMVDEAQFLTEKQIDELSDLVDKQDINVICYGLRTDFRTQLFPGSKRLFEIADSFEEIKSSCYCNSKTIFNARIDEFKNIITDGEQIEIGGDTRYTSLCRKCYFEKTNHPLYKKNKNNLD